MAKSVSGMCGKAETKGLRKIEKHQHLLCGSQTKNQNLAASFYLYSYEGNLLTFLSFNFLIYEMELITCKSLMLMTYKCLTRSQAHKRHSVNT
jgi:hypothetical protein